MTSSGENKNSARESVVGIDFRELQAESHEWRTRNFPETAHQSELQLLGVVEEVGELSHATLKAIQKIRGSEAEHRAAKMDAVGDIIVYLAGYCSAEDIDLQDCVETAWAEVKQRDWIKNPERGLSPAPVEDEK